jgi:large subunit ribosomal protein L4
MATPKKMRRVALKAALSSKVVDNNLIVLESLELVAPKTKEVVAMLSAFNAKKTLIITAEVSENVYKSARNIEGVAVAPVNNINVYDLLKYEKLIVTKDAVSKIEEVYA